MPETHTLEYAVAEPSRHLPTIKLTLQGRDRMGGITQNASTWRLDTADAYDLARQLMVLATSATDRCHAAQVRRLMNPLDNQPPRIPCQQDPADDRQRPDTASQPSPAATDCDGRPTAPPKQGPVGGV